MTYKIFTDGSHLKEFDVAGIGGYIVNNDDVVLEFSEKIEDSALYAKHEPLAIKKALEKALELNLQNEPIGLFSDAQDLILILNNPEREKYADRTPLLTDIFSLCEQFSNLSFNYIPRTENSKADKLSRKCIIDTLFTEHQIKNGAFSHKNLISKNNYPRENTSRFLEDRKNINHFLVVHCFRNYEKKLREINIFYAQKNDLKISYELKESFQALGSKWDVICIDLIDKHLKLISEKSTVIGLVLHDEFITLDQALRGRREFAPKNKFVFDKLADTLNNFDKVVIHRDAMIYEAIFKDESANMKAKIRP